MFGQVWKGECRGTEVAVKIPNRASLTPAQMQAFQTEMEIMKKIPHPNCCLFMGAHVDEQKRSLQIVTELCAGDMNKLILEDKRPFPLSQRLHWALQAARGLAWLHSLLPSPILHRDLKLANLLYDAEMNVKVADFGLAQVTEGGREVWDKNPRGSLLYMAPEVYRLTYPITPKTDVHSFAMVLWEFCTRREVYEEYFEPAKFVNDAFIGGKRPPIDPNWPARLQDLFRKMWAPEPDQRPEMKAVVEELGLIIPEVKRAERLVFVRATIPDPAGFAFWTQHFLDLDAVPLDRFAQEFYKALGIVLPKLDDKKGGAFSDDERKFYLLREMITTDKGHSSVDITEFGRILSWMGPLEVPAPAFNSLLDRLVDLVKHPWFHGLIDANHAEGLTLSPHGGNPVIGQFLVRFSLRTPGGFTITVNQKTSTVTHLIVYNTPGKGLTLDNVHYWPTVPALVAAVEQALELQHPVPNGWQFLWQGASHRGGYRSDLRDEEFASDDGLISALAGSSTQP